MELPAPVPGLVVRYGYLWLREQVQGREGGSKDRPCAIVAAVRSDANGNQDVLVLPITHSPPDQPEMSVELPQGLKRRLGLDDEPSWVVISEWNQFVWPGPDLRPTDRDARTPVFGMLPVDLLNSIRERFLVLAKSGRVRRVRRTQ